MKKWVVAVVMGIFFAFATATPALADPGLPGNHDNIIGDDTQPDFLTCININPLEFKWDWPCIMASLFQPSAMSQEQLERSYWDLENVFPFNINISGDAAGLGLTEAMESCTEFSFRIMGETMTLLPCDYDLAPVARQLTAAGFTIFIIITVGAWVFRLFLPSIPGDKT